MIMNKKKTRRTMMYMIFCAVLLVVTSCNEIVENEGISGQIINASTQEPIVGAIVKIVESGPSVETDENGTFAFTGEDIFDLEEIDNKGVRSLAVSISQNDYYPREANLSIGEETVLELSPKNAPGYFYNQPVQLNDGIATADLAEVDMDRQLIHNLMNELYRDQFDEVHSVLVYKDGYLVIEEYFYGNNDTIQFENGVIVDSAPDPIQWTRTEPHYVASVNKSLTSTIVGIAMDQNGISLDDKISTYLPEYVEYFEDENKANLTFRNCLTMQTGFVWDEWGSTDLKTLWQSSDFADYVLRRDNMGANSEWRYNSAIPNLMLKAVDNMVEGNVREWANDNFYKRLGIEDFDWQSQPDGYPEGSARMYLRPRDMLKIGITYLNQGKWNGEQVIPSQWVFDCFETQVDPSDGDYSYYFWLRELDGVHYLSADGDGGNYINVFPEQDMVVIFTQGLYLKWPSYVNQANDKNTLNTLAKVFNVFLNAFNLTN